MLWFWYSLVSALMTSCVDVLSKKLSQKYDYWFIAWLWFAAATPFLISLIFFIEIPKPDGTFYLALVILLPIEITATIFYIRAIKSSPLSLTIPLLGFTSIFLLFVPKLIIGEVISVQGGTGVFLIFLGAYILNIKREKYRIFDPIRAVIKNPGPRYMLVTAFLYSVSSTLGKILVNHSSSAFVAATYFPIVGIFFLPVVFKKSRSVLPKTSRDLLFFLLIGLCLFVASVTHFLAIERIEVAYMISIKRLSLLFSTIFGWKVFREKGIMERITGCIIIFIGIVLISLN